MTKLYGPFDAGAGSSMTENNWRKMAQMFAETGVLSGYLNELEVFGDSTGMQVKVPSGLAYVKGHFFESDAQETVTIAANASGNARIDRVVLEANFSTNVIDFVVVAGTPAGSPAAPSLTQDLTTKWQMPLAQVAVANGASTITAGNVTDERNVFTTRSVDSDGALVATAQASTSLSYGDLSTVGPAVTVTVGSSGKVLVIPGARITPGADSGFGYIGFAGTGANTVAASDARSASIGGGPFGLVADISKAVVLTGLLPGDTTFTAKYRYATGGGAATQAFFEDRSISAIAL
jgi:hypothetical protein